ncbi:MAG: ABC transporter ATP-binding protein [Acidilobaceae archaeon]
MSLIIEAKNLSKNFGSLRALDNVNLRVRRGEIVGLAGPNGAGKSTLLKIILGIMRRDSGEVLLNGYDPYYDSRARLGVGVIFERPMLPDSLTIRDLLYHASRIYGSTIEDIRSAIRYTGLEEHIHKPFSELSAGLKQRAAIAHALLSRPTLIIADEITSNLDPIERVKILDLIDILNKDEGITFIISSHVIPEISRIAKRVVVLNRGRVVMDGDVSDVILKTLVARIRSNDPTRLAKRLENEGYNVELKGLNIIVRFKSPEDQERLLSVLSMLSNEGIRLFSLDFTGAGLEEIIRGD